METAQLVADLNEAFEFAPVEGRSNDYVIRAKAPRSGSHETELTPADWNKFEQDITAAFEQIP